MTPRKTSGPAAKKPAHAKPAGASTAQRAESQTARFEDDTIAGGSGNDLVASERDVADGENETLVIASGGEAVEMVHQPLPLTTPQREAIASHLELRVAEMAHYIRTEAHKHGMEPQAFAKLFADQLRAGL
jgi:hypothetical protein